MKRFVKALLALMLVVTLIPVTPVSAEGEKPTLTIHFHKDDGDYTDYNLWTWDTGTVTDMVLPNYQDDYGIIWEYEVEEGANVGFIVRGSDGWDKKNCGEDSFVEVNEDTEIWVLEDDCTVYTENPTSLAGERKELGKIETEDETLVSDEAASAQLFIHYYRYEQDYPYWNVWSWVIGKEGAAFNFESEDDYGVVAKINYQDVTEGDMVGFIVRKGNWSSKDINEDRTVTFGAEDLVDGKYVKHIYLLQGDPAIHTTSDVDKSPRVKMVQFTGPKTVQIQGVSVESIDDVTVLNSKGEVIEFAHLLLQGSDITLLSETDLDILDTYKVSVKGYQGEYPILYDGLYDTKLFTEMFTYTGDDLGVTLKDGTSFRLWAPVSSKVMLNVFSSGDYRESDLEQSYEMTRSDKGTWVYKTNDDLSGKYYTYTVVNGNGEYEVADPYAFASGVNGHRSMILDISSVNTEFADHSRPEKLDYVDSIIYELHVRDLSMADNSGIENKGKFLGLIEKGTKNDNGDSTGLDHMIDLGITHLHLLPSFDHRSIDETKLDTPQFNWGYDPYNYSVVEGSYSTNPFLGEVRVNEFKTMVQTLHENDIRVVLDVVYNHTGASQDSHLNRIVPNYYYRTENGNFSNGSGCGNETASERPMVRKLIVDSVAFWAREYKLDGFRFDLMALHDIETMNEVRAVLDEIDSNIIVYGEGWTGGGTPLPQKDQALKVNVTRLDDIAVFSDDIRDGIKGSVFNAGEKGFVSGDFAKHMGVRFGIVGGVNHEQVLWSYHTDYPSQIINYVSAHDNLSLWDKLTASNGEENTVEELKKMHNMANAIVLTSQGIPFLHAGVELNRSKDMDHNSYSSSDEVNQIDWQTKTDNKDTFEYYQGLIALRKERDEFRLNDTELIQNSINFYDEVDGVIAYSIDAEYYDTQVVFNATTETQKLNAEFGFYKIVIKDDQAGTKMLGISFGEMTVAPLTTLVMVGINPMLFVGVGALIAVVLIAIALYFFKKEKK
jgi:pullulanase